MLLRTESASSSQIEGVTAGARALALAAIEQETGPNARLVAANVTALRRAVDLAEEISADTILAAHDALLTGHPYADPGRFRSRQVWIGSDAISPHTASFVPPHHDRVPAAMADLVAFVRRADLPVLVHAAVAHAQFETIHPFNDGNGRVGRTLVHAMLRRADVTRRLTVPVSAGLLTDTAAYFDALTAYREGDIAPIVRQFAGASFRAVDNGRHLVADLEQIHGEWSGVLSSRRGSAARRLLPLLLNQPAVNVAYVVDATGVALSAAQRAVEQPGVRRHPHPERGRPAQPGLGRTGRDRRAGRVRRAGGTPGLRLSAEPRPRPAPPSARGCPRGRRGGPRPAVLRRPGTPRRGPRPPRPSPPRPSRSAARARPRAHR
ncbi:Fic family protein [Nocardioides convexus]|uniref:Fic family protein n=1 Tax=Nocardioides convexus TaxID=2712224 RepID=UPI002418A096|nr:Fic family protein [Nocardioides convexus]